MLGKNQHTLCLSLLPSSSFPVDLDLSSPEITLLPYQFAAWEQAKRQPASFQEYIATLEEWEQQILYAIDIKEDIYILVQNIQKHIDESNGSIFATSDGSAPNFIGTFGWSLSLGNGQRLASNNGPAPGYRTTSF
jgi:hypothetical protein